QKRAATTTCSRHTTRFSTLTPIRPPTSAHPPTQYTSFLAEVSLYHHVFQTHNPFLDPHTWERLRVVSVCSPPPFNSAPCDRFRAEASRYHHVFQTHDPFLDPHTWERRRRQQMERERGREKEREDREGGKERERGKESKNGQGGANEGGQRVAGLGRSVWEWLQGGLWWGRWHLGEGGVNVHMRTDLAQVAGERDVGFSSTQRKQHEVGVRGGRGGSPSSSAPPLPRLLFFPVPPLPLPLPHLPSFHQLAVRFERYVGALKFHNKVGAVRVVVVGGGGERTAFILISSPSPPLTPHSSFHQLAVRFEPYVGALIFHDEVGVVRVVGGTERATPQCLTLLFLPLLPLSVSTSSSVSTLSACFLARPPSSHQLAVRFERYVGALNFHDKVGVVRVVGVNGLAMDGHRQRNNSTKQLEEFLQSLPDHGEMHFLEAGVVVGGGGWWWVVTD
ncbi:unnamed protein product, partial [Closterium sp. NIES-54]